MKVVLDHSTEQEHVNLKLFDQDDKILNKYRGIYVGFKDQSIKNGGYQMINDILSIDVVAKLLTFDIFSEFVDHLSKCYDYCDEDRLIVLEMIDMKL